MQVVKRDVQEWCACRGKVGLGLMGGGVGWRKRRDLAELGSVGRSDQF